MIGTVTLKFSFYRDLKPKRLRNTGVYTGHEASNVAINLAAELINFYAKTLVDCFITKVNDTLKRLSFVEATSLALFTV